MAYQLILFLFFLRGITLVISIRNEWRLRAAGAVEHGMLNSNVLMLLHISCYAVSAVEAYLYQPPFDQLALLGLSLYVFSALALMLVIRDLNGIWTIKILIAKEHQLVTSRLYRLIRHPNYFLNAIPELVGIGLMAHAWMALCVFLPLYLVSLSLRIYQEESAMRSVYQNHPHA